MTALKDSTWGLDMGKAKSQMNIKKAQSPVTASQGSLKREIRELEQRLQDQFVVRRTLERALGYKSSAIAPLNDTSMPKPTKELISEIAVLELEVMNLEQYLLSLYRKAFDQQVYPFSASATENRLKWSMNSSSRLFQDVARLDISYAGSNDGIDSSQIILPQRSAASAQTKSYSLGSHEKLGGQSVRHGQSLISQYSVCSARLSRSAENQTRSLWSCHSQPLTFTEHGQHDYSRVISLADYLGTRIADHVPETPNRISEDMVRCMVAIFCKFRDPPMVHQGFSSSPTSSFSSMSASSPRYLGEMQSPGFKRESTLDAWQLENPSGVEGLKEFSGPYNVMVEACLICKDSEKLSDVYDTLQKYKSLVHRLEKIDPRLMKNEEKLAFWINIHNALVMHAYLDYGIPQNNMRRASLLTKASYIIGGCAINANVIQNSILGCHTNLPGQWLRTLLLLKLKFKNGNQGQSYAIRHPEPLLHFALCSGSHSDPAVRIYTPKRVFQQLEAAREEYVCATVSIHKEQKIFLPKLIDAFAKDMGLSMISVLEMIQRYLPETFQIVMQRCQEGRSHKIVEWVPHNFTFRYLLSKELAIPHTR